MFLGVLKKLSANKSTRNRPTSKLFHSLIQISEGLYLRQFLTAPGWTILNADAILRENSVFIFLTPPPSMLHIGTVHPCWARGTEPNAWVGYSRLGPSQHVNKHTWSQNVVMKHKKVSTSRSLTMRPPSWRCVAVQTLARSLLQRLTGGSCSSPCPLEESSFIFFFTVNCFQSALF